MGCLRGKCSGKGKSNYKIPKSSMVRCFRNRSSHFGRSGMKEGKVIDEARKGKKARSHTPCQSLWEPEFLFPERWEATEGFSAKKGHHPACLTKDQAHNATGMEVRTTGGRLRQQCRTGTKVAWVKVVGVGPGDLDILCEELAICWWKREKNGKRWHLLF